MADKPVLFWVDVETTGLEDHDVLLEIAVILTDTDLQPLAPKSFTATLCVDKQQMQALKKAAVPYVQQMHTNSGLWQDLVKSTNGYASYDLLDKDLLKYIEDHAPEETQLITAGNSVHFDVKVIKRYLPEVAARLHYKIIDVSSVQLLEDFWNPQPETARAPIPHRALADIVNSIKQLRRLRKTSFKVQPPVARYEQGTLFQEPPSQKEETE